MPSPDPSSLVARDLAVLWHPCSQMRDYRDFPPLDVVAACGSWITLADGSRLLDAIASWWCKSLGHGHPRLIAALTAQAARFEHVILANTTHVGVVGLCERVIAAGNGFGSDSWGPMAPPGRRPGWFGKVFLADNGSTGVEVALKLALHVQALHGRTRRTRFAALADGYHGETAGALSVSDCGLYKDAYRPLLVDCTMLGPLPRRHGPEDADWQDASAEWPAIERQLAAVADTLAAIIYEPVLQGAGGMRLYSPDLLCRLRAWADAHDVLLIADEIAAGWGRCGAMLASHLAWPRSGGDQGCLPDLAVIAKGLTAGVLPMSAVLTTDAIAAACDGEWHERRAFLHSNTHAGNALAVAVANAALDVYADEDVLGQVARRGPALRGALAGLAEQRPYLHQARGVGLIAAVDLRRADGGPLDPQQRTGWRCYREAVRRGALLRPLGDTLYLCPPLTASDAELAAMVAILADSVAAVLG